MNSQHRKPGPIVYRDTVLLRSPYLPVIFNENHLDLFRPLTPECPLTKPIFPHLIIAQNRLFSDIHNKNSINREAYNYLIKNNLKQIKYTTADFSGEVEQLEKMGSNIFQHLFKVDSDLDHDNGTKPERFRPKRRYWIYNGEHKFQLSQYQTSQNWYKGEGKHFNLFSYQKLIFNYKKNKFMNNNTVEWRMSFFTNSNDTVRFYRIGEDLIRTYSDFGIHAFQNWFYSSNIEIKTQVFKRFDQNSTTAFSAAFSPLSIDVGFLGMKFALNKTFPKVKGKSFNFTADISPLSINYLAVLNKNIDPRRFGIEEEKWHFTKFGSAINSNLIFNIKKNVVFTSRFKFFTSYENISCESENKLDMPINRYFSTSIYLYARFDDNKGLIRDPSLGYFQINESLTFGFYYKW